jgi:hypothetical protein
VVRGDPATRAFSTLGFRDGDHAAARRIIGTTKTLTPEEAADRRSISGVWRKGREPTYYLILRSGAKHRVSKDGPVRAILSPSWSVLRDAPLCAAPQDEAACGMSTAARKSRNITHLRRAAIQQRIICILRRL